MIDFTKASKKTGQIERENIKLIQDAYQGAYNDIQKQIQAIYADPKNLDANGNLIGAAMLREKRFLGTQAKINEALNRAGTEYKGVLSSAVKETYKVNFEYGQKSLGEMDIGIDFGMINREAVAKAAISPLALTAIEENADTVISAVKKSIVSSIVSGASIDTMATRIQKDLQNNANNAVRIARTETTRIMGEARDELLHQASDLGLHVVKVWIATSDDRTRESHVHINGEERELDQPFSNGLMFPGDTSTGDPAETINCRCAMAAKTIPTPAQARSEGVSILSAVRQNDEQMKAEYDAWKAAKALAKNNVAKVAQKPFSIESYTPMSQSEIAANNKYLESLSVNEQNAIRQYTGQSYHTINADLRAGRTSEQYYRDIIADIDKAFREAPPLKTDTIVTRRVRPDAFDSIFGEGTSQLMKDAGMISSRDYDPAAFDQLKKRIIGSTITDKGFVSTTNDDTLFGTMAFALPKGYNNGLYIQELSHFRAEEEFLINRGQTFVVRDIIHTKEHGILQIILGPKP